jgi:hypothetical protein
MMTDERLTEIETMAGGCCYSEGPCKSCDWRSDARAELVAEVRRLRAALATTRAEAIEDCATACDAVARESREAARTYALADREACRSEAVGADVCAVQLRRMVKGGAR